MARTGPWVHVTKDRTTIPVPSSLRDAVIGLSGAGAIPARPCSLRDWAAFFWVPASAEGTAGNGAPRRPALGQALGSQERSRRPFSLSWRLPGGRQFEPSAPSGRVHPAKLFVHHRCALTGGRGSGMGIRLGVRTGTRYGASGVDSRALEDTRWACVEGAVSRGVDGKRGCGSAYSLCACSGG